MLCYRCNTVMKKILFNNELIDKCPYCNGIWLDSGEFESILYKLSKKTKEELRIKCIKEIKDEEMGYNILCPKCKIGKLVRKKVYGIEIDRCKTCKGVFFDDGEFEKLMTEYRKRNAFISFFEKLFLRFKGKKKR